ncbi:hypothetical protein [Streptomyces sp. FXJ1.172]|uniref:hypothetical protein n=1 Tax=Streptomyces sp. FXJ1.172 TaxID=710705 RepID=UPI0007CFEE02
METLVNALPILTRGAPAYAATGTERSTGPKLFCASGSVARSAGGGAAPDHRAHRGRGDGIALLREIGRPLWDASICGLGQTAWNAVDSAIDRLGAYA